MAILDFLKKGLNRIAAGAPHNIATAIPEPEPVEEQPERQSYEWPADESAVIGEFERAYEEEINRRSGYEKTWFMNFAFLLGKHWVQWDDHTGKFLEPKAPSWRVHLTINKILRFYRKSLSWLLNYNPRVVVTPNTGEEEDIRAAQLGTKAITHLREKLHIRQKNLEMNEWRLICGTAFKYFYWDSQAGDKIETETGESLYTGEVNIEIINSYEIYPISGGFDIESCRQLMWVKYVSLEDIKAMYPDKSEEVKEEKDTSSVGLFFQKIEGLVSTTITTASGTQARNTGMVMLKRVWERSSEKYDKGRFIAYANGVLLEYGPVPNAELGKIFEIPFTKYDDIQVPGRFWGQATIEQLAPVNKEFNKTRSQIIESKNLMGKPKWVAAKGSLTKSEITSEPGEVLEPNTSMPGYFEPHPIPPPPLPEYIIRLPEMLDRDMQDIGAAHDAPIPPGIKSGRAIRLLREGDREEAGAQILQNAENEKIEYSALLRLIQANYTEQRMIKTLGKNNEFEIMAFTGADLKNNTDCYIEENDLVPISRTGRQELVLDYYDMGLLGNKNSDITRKRTLRMLEAGNVDDVWEEANEDIKQARSENKKIDENEAIVPMFWENHTTHIVEHRKVMISPFFNKKSPAVQELFIDHLKRHQEFLNPALSQQAEPVAGEIPVMPGGSPAVLSSQQGIT